MAVHPLPRPEAPSAGGGFGVVVVVGSGAVFGWVRSLAAGADDDASRVDRLRVLEDLKSAICAEQAVLAVDLDSSQRSTQESAGVATRQRGRGVAAQVALARRESPHRGQVLLGLGQVLVAEMPHTLDRLGDGTLSEFAAICLAKETGCLTLADRQVVDEQLCGDPETVAGWGVHRLAGQARRLAQTLDAAACVRRAARARSERCVTLRPAPDAMTYLTALLPLEQGVAAYAALCAAADTVVATGDPGGLSADCSNSQVSGGDRDGGPGNDAGPPPRTRGQVMADTLVQRLTGQARADQVPLTVNLVISDDTLLNAGIEPAVVEGGVSIPGVFARLLVHDGLDRECRTDLRRLYATPDTGQLVALESRARIFPTGLARFIDLRDQTCRTPWCDAPIRHHDHVLAHAAGGPTNSKNSQGLCAACNHAKQAPGWSATVPTRASDARPLGPPRPPGAPGAPHTVLTTTPTGQQHQSRAPRLPAPLRQ